MFGLFSQQLCSQLHMGFSEVVSFSSDLLKSLMCRCILSVKGVQLFIRIRRMANYLPTDSARSTLRA